MYSQALLQQPPFPLFLAASGSSMLTEKGTYEKWSRGEYEKNSPFDHFWAWDTHVNFSDSPSDQKWPKGDFEKPLARRAAQGARRRKCWAWSGANVREARGFRDALSNAEAWVSWFRVVPLEKGEMRRNVAYVFRGSLNGWLRWVQWISKS